MSKYPDKYISFTEHKPLSSVFTISFLGAITGGIILILYFLILALTNYYTILGLRYLNFMLLIPLIVISIKRYLNTTYDKSSFEAFVISFLTIVGSYCLLAVFIVVYITLIDRNFLHYVQNHLPGNIYLDVPVIAFGLLAEGIAGGVVLSFILLQFFKKRMNEKFE